MPLADLEILTDDPLDWSEVNVLVFGRREGSGTDRANILGSREFQLHGTRIGIQRIGPGGNVHVVAFRTAGLVEVDEASGAYLVHVARDEVNDVGNITTIRPPIAGDYDLTLLLPPLPSLARAADDFPSFEGQGIAAIGLTVGTEIQLRLFPEATGGQGTPTYAITPDLPAGVLFDPATRLFSGTPSAVSSARAYVYSATDEAGRADEITFTLGVTA